MTDKGLVTIIVPVFNQEQYLNNSITSLRFSSSCLLLHGRTVSGKSGNFISE